MTIRKGTADPQIGGVRIYRQWTFEYVGLLSQYRF